LRFPGQHFDEETRVRFWNANEGHYQSLRPALHDNRHRVYDPFLGTYLQADPLLARSWSSYEYARSNPVMRTDRLGLEVECDGSCMDEIINVRGVVDDWGYFDLDGPGTWGWDLPPDHDDRPPRWPVGDEPESAPEREDCHGNYSGKECTDCCYRNYSNVDAPTCRRKRTRTQRQACWALAASTMAACISMCRRDELGPLEPTRSMEEISPGDYRFDGFGGGQFGGGGTGGNF
jgi:RHS repeat-associated protein